MIEALDRGVHSFMPSLGDYSAEVRETWTTGWPSGSKETESSWIDMKCDGITRTWNSDGNLLKEIKYRQGKYIQ
jgi:hypothetical protein